ALFPHDERAHPVRLLHVRDWLHRGDALRRDAGPLRSVPAVHAGRARLGGACVTPMESWKKWKYVVIPRASGLRRQATAGMPEVEQRRSSCRMPERTFAAANGPKGEPRTRRVNPS